MRYYILLACTLLIVASCNPVRRVQRNDERRQAVAAYLISQGICNGDTILQIIRDTTVTHDTSAVIYLWTDTTLVHDTAYITEERWRNVTKTVKIRDTVRLTVTDIRAMDELEKEWRKCQQAYARELADRAKYVWGICLLLFMLFLSIVALVKK